MRNAMLVSVGIDFHAAKTIDLSLVVAGEI